MSFVALKDIDVSYDKKTKILEGLNLEIQQGELVSLLGPSGCGKSTTLRMIAGFVDAQSGSFTLDGEELGRVPIHKRNFGIVFQSYALFPHMSVYDNVAFGLKMRRLPKDEIDRKVREMLEICGLSELAERFPRQMSGGQRQRVALARALVIEPKLLLLDEPLSNLDAKLRIAMRMEIKRIQKRLKITTIFVTHDQEECFSISDKVAIMNRGKIEQYDSPEQIYRSPRTEFVARFIGFENFLRLHRSDKGWESAEGVVFEPQAESLAALMSEAGSLPEVLTATIRPDDIEAAEGPAPACLKVRVGVRTFLGQRYQYELLSPEGKLLWNVPAERQYEEGAELWVRLPQSALLAVRTED